MEPLPHRFDETPGDRSWTMTSLLKDFLESLTQDPDDQKYKELLLQQLTNYTNQLRQLRTIDQAETTREVYRAIDYFFKKAPDEVKDTIRCKTGCTACCFIELDVSGDEAFTILSYCRENNIPVDREYLEKQTLAGRKKYSAISRCVFLQDNLCQVYPVRPAACRKHWVHSDPAWCDTSRETENRVHHFFEVNSEILASAVLHTGETGSLEHMLLLALRHDLPLPGTIAEEIT